ncbi:MAG: DUF1343 domain-containing protein [Armatimonadetes bacterium]|nr:DUF1343 domain-containing protein [Armatimonadota bacterium]
MNRVQLGIEKLVDKDWGEYRNKRVGLVCNQASILSDYRHVLDHALQARLDLGAVFGPQHGIWGHTQDNMIEWEGYRDEQRNVIFHSLYGENRKPTAEMLRGLDALIIDLPDVGSRYYTFQWTMALCMEACDEEGIPVVVTDRPNPIGGYQTEGTMLDMEYTSFVGLFPIPTRPGLTIGELAKHFKRMYFPDLDLKIIKMDGWERAMYFPETGLPWVMPSPNMPTVDTALVYPGQCLLEGTQVSEGRGTTRPFEMFGAPYFDVPSFCEELGRLKLNGVAFRPIQFEPTFHKFAKQVCQGAFIHVTDRNAFEPVLTSVGILQTLLKLYREQFQWSDPPYEYVYDRQPIDLLLGSKWLRRAVEEGSPIDWIRDQMRAESKGFLNDIDFLY